MAGKKDIQDLSADWELLNELKSSGLKVGPISPTTRYGVCFDLVCSSSESGLPAPAVFISKEEALKTVKKFKGALFKDFKTRDEAERFSRS